MVRRRYVVCLRETAVPGLSKVGSWADFWADHRLLAETVYVQMQLFAQRLKFFKRAESVLAHTNWTQKRQHQLHSPPTSWFPSYPDKTTKKIIIPSRQTISCHHTTPVYEMSEITHPTIKGKLPEACVVAGNSICSSGDTLDQPSLEGSTRSGSRFLSSPTWVPFPWFLYTPHSSSRWQRDARLIVDQMAGSERSLRCGPVSLYRRVTLTAEPEPFSLLTPQQARL